MKPKNIEVIIREARNEDWAAVSELLAAAKLVPLALRTNLALPSAP